MEELAETGQEEAKETQDATEPQLQEVEEVEEKKHILKRFPKPGSKNLLIALGSFLVILAGVGTGWLLSGGPRGKGAESAVSQVAPGGQKTEVGAGISDEETFRDSAEGTLVEGGIDGEGTHHLERGLGADKDVYLTSTVIDLQVFAGKKVKVWGETIGAQKAGWLMDVGKIKIIE